MSRPPRSRIRLAAPLLLVAAIIAGCSSNDANVQAAPGSTAPATTDTAAPTTTEAPKPKTTEIATAKSSMTEVQVYAQKPAGSTSGGAIGATPAAFHADTVHPPIPRDGYATAGVRKTATGWAYTNPTYFKNPLVFQVIAHDGDWLNVWIAARPNQQQGWIKAADVDLSSTTFRMELSVSEHHLKVYDGETIVVDTKVVDGTPNTKTPQGHFYVNEKIKSDNDAGPYGFFILSTNGYSEDLNVFDNGLPVVAFHGTNQPELLGQSKSNGCVRMPNDVDQKLAATIPAGTPIEIGA